MSGKILMRDGDCVLTYEGLLARVNGARTYCPALRAGSLAEFVSNLVVAISRGVDITLLDSDLSAEEIAGLGVSGPDMERDICGADFADIGALMDAVKKSTSKISIFTSGTTGLPKRVEHTVASLAAHVRVSENYSGHIWGFCYNPTHMAGLQVLFQILFNQNTAVNLFGKSKRAIYGGIDEYGITHISATPTFYRLLMPENAAHPSVRRITLGGEKSDKALYGALLEVFPNAKINNIYASTEGGTLLASGGEYFKIPEGEKGRIVVDENNELLVHRSLLGESESFVLDGDYYRTGDLVEWVGEGKKEFRFLGRKSSLVNVGGYKVNLEEVEDALRSMPEVADALAFGRENSVLGNILCADVRLKEGAHADVAQVRGFLAERLQQFKIPRKIRFVESMESTATGKIKRL